jgi:hypothetical protein
MQETQDTIVEWIERTFPGNDPDSPRKSLRALEEMVELCRASGASDRDIVQAVYDALTAPGPPLPPLAGWSEEQPPLEPGRIEEEAADVQILLYGVAGMRGFDLRRATDRKMVRNRARSWRILGDGTGYHVPGSDPGTIPS